MIKKIIPLFLLTISVFSIKAQQEIMVSQYMFNGLFLNPAYAGSHKYFTSTFLYRNQWVNFSGSPQTAMIAVDGPLVDQKMGVGLMVINDKIGATNQTDIYANYSYFVKTNRGRLGFGIKAGASQYFLQVSDLIYWDTKDVVFSGANRKQIIPKFGFGSYYYSDKFYAGISVPSFVSYQKDDLFNTFVKKHYYLTSGYVAALNESVKVKPSILLKYEKAAPLQADFNVTAFYLDELALGVAYRTSKAFIVMVEYHASKRFRVGYAYDMDFSDLNKYSSGSHEIMIGIDFGKDMIATKTPRFF